MLPWHTFDIILVYDVGCFFPKFCQYFDGTFMLFWMIWCLPWMIDLNAKLKLCQFWHILFKIFFLWDDFMNSFNDHEFYAWKLIFFLLMTKGEKNMQKIDDLCKYEISMTYMYHIAIAYMLYNAMKNVLYVLYSLKAS